MLNAKTTIAMCICLLLGSAFGWVFCTITSSPSAEARTLPRDICNVKELRIIDDDGLPCLSISGTSFITTMGLKIRYARIEFYNSKGEVSHTIGTDYVGNLFILDNQKGNRAWGIYEPEETFKYHIDK
jgi:hypothetical protein